MEMSPQEIGKAKAEIAIKIIDLTVELTRQASQDDASDYIKSTAQKLQALNVVAASLL